MKEILTIIKANGDSIGFELPATYFHKNHFTNDGKVQTVFYKGLKPNVNNQEGRLKHSEILAKIDADSSFCIVQRN